MALSKENQEMLAKLPPKQRLRVLQRVIMEKGQPALPLQGEKPLFPPDQCLIEDEVPYSGSPPPSKSKPKGLTTTSKNKNSSQPIDYDRLGRDFFRCYFGDVADISVTELAKVIGAKNERIWGNRFICWVEQWKMPCTVKNGSFRVTPAALGIWFERESNRRQSAIMTKDAKYL
jgi:hypothetical protein